jgi:hypothetical protein
MKEFGYNTLPSCRIKLFNKIFDLIKIGRADSPILHDIPNKLNGVGVKNSPKNPIKLCLKELVFWEDTKDTVYGGS